MPGECTSTLPAPLLCGVAALSTCKAGVSVQSMSVACFTAAACLEARMCSGKLSTVCSISTGGKGIDSVQQYLWGEHAPTFPPPPPNPLHSSHRGGGGGVLCNCQQGTSRVHLVPGSNISKEILFCAEGCSCAQSWRSTDPSKALTCGRPARPVPSLVTHAGCPCHLHSSCPLQA